MAGAPGLDMDRIADGGTAVDPTDKAALREHLEQFAGTGTVTESDDGTLKAAFSRSTFVTVGPEGRISTGMPLHGFEGPADQLVFDHEDGELHVSAGGDEIAYTFRRP
jgi:hypothetical protein